MRLRRELLDQLTGLILLLAPLTVAGQHLAGWAELAPGELLEGPASGQFLDPPRLMQGQPLQGISSLVAMPDGSFLALLDNGFGKRSNSADFLLRVVRLRVDFERGSVEAIPEFIINDASGHWGLARVGDGARYPGSDLPVPQALVTGGWLTGHDADPESLEPGLDGDYWVGDEFGPYLLHLDGDGRLLEAPIALPGVRAPETDAVTPTVGSSAGFEAMARVGNDLWVLLEKPGPDNLVPVFRYDLVARAWDPRRPVLRLPVAEGATSVGAATAMAPDCLVLIERDSAEGDDARHKWLVAIAFDAASGRVRRRPLLDLLAIPDPDERHPEPGDYGMPMWTLESVVVVDAHQLLIANDNNYPLGAARGGPAGSETTELALIRWPEPLRSLCPARP